jgi:hypothetical protein
MLRGPNNVILGTAPGHAGNLPRSCGSRDGKNIRRYDMSKRTLVVLALTALCIGTVALAEDATQLQNWTVSPYWTAPSGHATQRTAQAASLSGDTSVSGLVAPPETDIYPFTAIEPCRLVDTRTNEGSNPFGTLDGQTANLDFFTTNPHS